MSTLQQKIAGHTKRWKTLTEEKKQAPEPDSDMAGMLELSDCEFKKTMISMLKSSNGKIRQHAKQIGNVSREL